jgi:hypothetical protein
MVSRMMVLMKLLEVEEILECMLARVLLEHVWKAVCVKTFRVWKIIVHIYFCFHNQIIIVQTYLIQGYTVFTNYLTI